MYKNNRDIFSAFTETFRNDFDKHAPLKTKRARGNQNPFMTKELRKGVMYKSKTRNKYIKWLSRENILVIKIAKYYCNNLTKTTKKNFFQRVTENGFVNNNKFRNTVKPFKTKLANLFNLHYNNIDKKTSPKETLTILIRTTLL